MYYIDRCIIKESLDYVVNFFYGYEMVILGVGFIVGSLLLEVFLVDLFFL